MNPFFRPLLIIFLIALSALHTGCEKRLFDYRNSHTGSYKLKCEKSWWNINGEYGSSIMYFPAVVYYNKHEKDMLHVKFGNEDLVVEVKRNGDIVTCDNIVGKFEENSFAFHNTYCGSSAHGGSGSFSWSGNRK